MKVILLQELKGAGIEGDVVEVSSGYANNYLLPNKLAVKADAGNLKQLEQRRHNIAKREEERMAAAEGLKEKMDGLSVQIEARVGEEGQLFGSVTTQMIADALREQHGIEVDKKLIDLKAAIKTAGEHDAVISLHRDIKSEIKLIVGDPEAIAAAAAAAEAAAAEEAAAKEAAAAAEAAAAEAEAEAEVAGAEVAEAAEGAEAEGEAEAEVEAEVATDAVEDAAEAAEEVAEAAEEVSEVAEAAADASEEAAEDEAPAAE